MTFDNYIENLILPDVYRHLWHLTTILKTLYYQTCTDTCDIWQLYWKPYITRRLQTLVTFDNYIENLILPDVYRHLWHLTTILKTLYYQTCTDTCDIWQLYWKPYITRRLLDNYIENLILPDVYRRLWHLTTILKTLSYQTSTDTCDIWHLYWKPYITRRVQTLVTFDNYIENLILPDVYRHLWHLTTILKTLYYQTSTDTCDIWQLYWKPYITRRVQTLVTFDNYIENLYITCDRLYWKPYITRRVQTLVTFDNYIENLILPDVYRHLWHLTTILKTLYYQTCTDTCDIWQLYWKPYITRRLQTLVTFDNYIENLILPDVYRHLWHLTTILKTLYYQTCTDTCDIWQLYWKPYITRRVQTLVTFDNYIENLILPDVYRHLWHLTTILKTLYYQTCTDTCDIWQLYWKPYITRRVQTLVTFDNYIENLILADVYRHLWHLTTILKTLYYQTCTDTCDIWQLYWKPYITRRLQTLVTFDNYIENLILADVYRHLWHLTTILKTLYYQTSTDTCDIWHLYWKPYITRRVQTLVTFDNYIENLILPDVYRHLWHLTTILKTLYYQTSTDTCDIWQLYWKPYITRRVQTLVTFDNYIENLILPDVYRHLWHLTTILKTLYYQASTDTCDIWQLYWKPYISRRLQTLVTFDIYIENPNVTSVCRRLLI